MRKLFWLVPAVLAVCVGAFGLSSGAVSADDELRVKILLTGPRIGGIKPQGNSVYRDRADGSRRFKVEASRVNLANGTVLTAYVNGVSVGSFSLAAGIGKVELNTNDDDVVPVIVAGDAVTVLGPGDVLVLKGSF